MGDRGGGLLPPACCRTACAWKPQPREKRGRRSAGSLRADIQEIHCLAEGDILEVDDGNDDDTSRRPAPWPWKAQAWDRKASPERRLHRSERRSRRTRQPCSGCRIAWQSQSGRFAGGVELTGCRHPLVGAQKKAACSQAALQMESGFLRARISRPSTSARPGIRRAR